MVKKINNFILSSIIASVLFILIGLSLIIFPEVSLNIIAYIIAAIFIILGIYLLVINNKFILLMDTIMSGILMILLGVILMMYPKSLSLLIPVILGVWIIISSVVKIRISISLKEYKDTPWVLCLVLSIISLICGIIFIINPMVSSSIVTTLVGFLIVIYAIANIVDMMMLKTQIKKIIKAIEKHFKVIEME